MGLGPQANTKSSVGWMVVSRVIRGEGGGLPRASLSLATCTAQVGATVPSGGRNWVRERPAGDKV